MVNREVVIRFAAELIMIEEDIVAGLAPIVKSWLQNFHQSTNFIEKENIWRAANVGDDKATLHADEQTAEIVWDYSDLLQTIVGRRYGNFVSFIREKRPIPNPPELRHDVRGLVVLRDKGEAHRNLGEFTKDDYDEVIRKAARVLRTLGAMESARQVEQKTRFAANSEIVKQRPGISSAAKMQQPITHDDLFSILNDDGIRIGPILEQEHLEGAFDVDSTAYRDNDGISKHLFIGWQRAFEHAFFCAWRNDLPLAGIGFIPVDGGWAQRFRGYEVDETDLTAAVIKRSNYSVWYFSGLSGQFCSKHDTPAVQRKEFVDILGRCLLAWACDNVTRIDRKPVTILAEGTTDFGQLLLKLFEFAPCQSLVPSKKKPRFYRETTLAEIKYALATDPFFNYSKTLHDRVMDASPLSHL